MTGTHCRRERTTLSDGSPTGVNLPRQSGRWKKPIARIR